MLVDRRREGARALLKLVLFEAPGAPERLNHLGVEKFETGQVRPPVEARDTLRA